MYELPELPNQMELSIDFYEEEVASLLIESNTEGHEEKFAEVLMFSCLTLRRMYTLKKKYVSQIVDLLEQIGRDSHEFFEGIVTDPNYPRIVNCRGPNGIKRIKADLTFRMGLRATFDLYSKGLGRGKRGMNFYGPHSVILLYQFLLEKRPFRTEYADQLVEASRVCVMVYTQGKVNEFTYVGLALGIATHAFGYPLPPIKG